MAHNQRRICIVTGSRAEYGLLRPVIDAVSSHRALSLQLVVTGAHLSRTFGMTVRQIERDGYPISARVRSHPSDDSGRSVAGAVADGIRGMAAALERLDPQVVVLLGDRFEILAAAVASTYMGVPVAHIHGGDVTRGGADESARHAITKMAHLHFPATADSAARIRRMGEDPWRIKVVGAPCLDTLLKYRKASRREIDRQWGLPAGRPYFVLAQHPVGTDAPTAVRQIRQTLEALRSTGQFVVAIYPNADAGGRAMIAELRKFRSEPWFRLYQSLPHEDFANLVRHSAAMVGNSSAGIIESPALGVAAVNIGHRQDGRQRAGNVIDAPHDVQAIGRAIARATSRRFQNALAFIDNPYGGGNAGRLIARRLASVALDRKLLQKKFNDDR
ncbi:MAG: UDP-N-acetylglucosamine 2-epimerase (hydrolyzing) [Phycisphaerales bacterium]|nr:UDP-N-acetylglucosamine 2-epimerase (hydrolyzing) [Phycisphaerales bacterium]